MTDKTIIKGDTILKDEFTVSVGDVNKLVLKIPNFSTPDESDPALETTVTIQKLRIYFNADFTSTRVKGASNNDEDTTIQVNVGSASINSGLATSFTPVSFKSMEFEHDGETYILIKYMGDDIRMINKEFNYSSYGLNNTYLEVWIKSGATFCLRKSTDVAASPSSGETVAYSCWLFPTISRFTATSTAVNIEDPFITDPHGVLASGSPLNSHLSFADSTGQEVISMTHANHDYQSIFNTGESQTEPILDITADARFQYVESIDSTTTPPTINRSTTTITEIVKDLQNAELINETQNTRLQAVEAKVGFPVGSVYQFASTGTPTLPDAIASLGTWIEINYITYTVSGTNYNVKMWMRTA